MAQRGYRSLRFALLLAFGSFGSGASAQLADVVPIIVAPAVHSQAIAPAADSRMMVLGIPLKNAWQVPMINGRPPLSIQGAERWQFTTTATWPTGAVRWALARAVVPGGPDPQTDLGFTAGLGVSAGANLAELLPDGGALIDTGVLQAEVRTGAAFNVLDKVVADGRPLVNSGASPGIVAFG